MMNFYWQLITKRRFLFLNLIILVISCSPKKEDKAENQLLSQNCQSCHLLPDPKHLIKNTWEFDVLPKMAARVGLQSGKANEITTLKEMALFPDTTAMSLEEWQELKNFVLAASPSLPFTGKSLLNIKPQLNDFEVVEANLPNTQPFITLTHFDTLTHKFYFGNASSKSVHVFDIEEGIKESIKLTGSPSYLSITENGYFVLTMGEVMPHNKKIGTLTYVSKNESGGFDEPEILLDDLQRPVHASLGDLDADGKEDIVISAFGNYKGELAWYSNVLSDEREKHVLRSLPGAIKTVLSDFNHDGLTDILALMAQGDEGFYLYLNQGNGKFVEKILMRFPPTYGSTYFDWIDFDGDGLEDIIYVNGDNGDYMPIVKNFHGIRLYLNKGNMDFEEALFIEHHGVFKAKAEDFDMDGDLDLAAISYFPDYEGRPAESFVYYENKGYYQFEASTFENQPTGKWLTMETGDLDGDGDKDILLGSAMFMVADAPKKIMNNWRRHPVPLMILKNTLKDKVQ
ncbi:FG-GAP repeat domain-containing protein [Chondrinema litorale]|uniref:FG-GAP repeat domain-containing protein n=1 Tax=Chondrinema litorale TaxID=2994555 RepID=UPI0025428C30|nr:VCBS repeat-containing protein [Chondrinema litorale]UZR96520.1 VCBS repeat-containing protein [Chondrinema litorale]